MGSRLASQIRPIWFPAGSLGAFQYLIAVICPATALWNFMPSSYEPPVDMIRQCGRLRREERFGAGGQHQRQRQENGLDAQVRVPEPSRTEKVLW